MLTKTGAEARVACGAAYLDRVRPGWFTRIDVGELTLASNYSCVMAQSYDREYCDACRSAGIQFLSRDGDADAIETEAQALGFYAAQDASFDELQDAWIAAIAARRHPVAEEQDTERSASAPATNAVREEMGEPVVAIRASESSCSFSEKVTQ